MQYPTEVPGVSLADLLEAAFVAGDRDPAEVPALVTAEAARIGFDARFLTREVNVDLSGGEKKRNETLQMGVLAPRFAILDELDSGLDVDALRACSKRVEEATNETGLGVLAITHYRRLLTELKPDVVHVLAGGQIRATGGPELADELEETGYAAYGTANEDEPAARPALDPFADPFA
jgi:Fe-S cluster assembly ATP-binding protein